MRKVAILPTLCTLGNAICGMSALVFATHISVAAAYFEPKQSFFISGCLIFLAMIFDVLDGYLARRTKAASQFGAELDSLCDAISFGVVPGFLLIKLGGNVDHRLMRDLYLVVAMLYMCCAVLRLARFNIQSTLEEKSHTVFSGLPSPAAAGCIAAMMMLYYNYTDIRWVPEFFIEHVIPTIAPLAGMIVALLMVSRVPYPHLANRVLRRRQHFNRVIQIVLFLFGIYLFHVLVLVLAFWGYALSGPIKLAWRRITRGVWSAPAEVVENPSTPIK